MYITTVKYEDFDGKTIKKNLLFHMSTKDWVKADAEKKAVGGYEQYLSKQLGEPGSNVEPAVVLETLEDIIRRSYGERSEDGEKFVKDPERTDHFMESLAYDAFLDDLIYTDGFSTAFVQALIPKGAKPKDN